MGMILAPKRSNAMLQVKRDFGVVIALLMPTRK
jgi:hypothetical protein